MAEQRMPAVEGIPAVRAISAEPLLGFIDPRVFRCGRCCGSGTVTLGQARYTDWHGPCPTCRGRGVSVDWIIAGGETGAKARPTHPDAVRDLLEFSLAYDVPFFFKQWGEWAPADPNHLTGDGKYMGKYRSFRLGKTGPVMARLGKKNAGKKLDGIEWTQTPPFNPPTPYSDLPL